MERCRVDTMLPTHNVVMIGTILMTSISNDQARSRRLSNRPTCCFTGRWIDLATKRTSHYTHQYIL